MSHTSKRTTFVPFIQTYYTELKERIPKLVSESFGLNKKYISADRNIWAYWTNTKRRSMLLLMPREITKMLHFLLDNVYIQVGDRVFQQCIGIPMGTN